MTPGQEPELCEQSTAWRETGKGKATRWIRWPSSPARRSPSPSPGGPKNITTCSCCPRWPWLPISSCEREGPPGPGGTWLLAALLLWMPLPFDVNAKRLIGFPRAYAALLLAGLSLCG